MKPSFVTWQLRRLHAELDVIDKQRGDLVAPAHSSSAALGRSGTRDRAARRALLDRMLRSLPKRFGFRDARSFAQAFARASELGPAMIATRRRLSSLQVQELERRVLNNEHPADIARAIGCAQQTVLNRASQLRKRLADLSEKDGAGI